MSEELTPEIESWIRLAKAGDVDGHEFHGNQYSQGVGGGGSSAPRRVDTGRWGQVSGGNVPPQTNPDDIHPDKGESTTNPFHGNTWRSEPSTGVIQTPRPPVPSKTEGSEMYHATPDMKERANYSDASARQSLLSQGTAAAEGRDQQAALKMAQQHVMAQNEALSRGDVRGAQLHSAAYKQWQAVYQAPAYKVQNDDAWSKAIQSTQRAVIHEPDTVTKGDVPGHPFHGNQYGAGEASADLRALADRAEKAPVRQRISSGQDVLGRTWNKGNAGYGYKVSERLAKANKDIAETARSLADKIDANPKTAAEHIADIRQSAQQAKDQAMRHLMVDNFSTGFATGEHGDLLNKIADHLQRNMQVAQAAQPAQPAVASPLPSARMQAKMASANAVASQGTGADKTYEAHKAAKEAWLGIAASHEASGETKEAQAARDVAQMHSQQMETAAADDPYEPYIPKESFDRAIAKYESVAGPIDPQVSTGKYADDAKEAARLSQIAASQHPIALDALGQKGDAHILAAQVHNAIRSRLESGMYPEIGKGDAKDLAKQHAEASHLHETAGFVSKHASTPGSSDDSVDSAAVNGDKADALSQQLANNSVFFTRRNA